MPLRTSPTSRLATRRAASRGQVVVIFAGAMLLFAMLMAAVVDLSWYWTNNLRMQRAADAAALAGVVWLPGDPAQAFATAQAEAVKNGYTTGVAGVVVTPSVDPNNDRRLLVNISGPVGTYFARIAGLTQINASRNAKADYVLPVPMGSPENYYGVFGLTRGLTTTGTITIHTPTPTTTQGTPGNTGLKIPTLAPTSTAVGTWTASSGAIPASVGTNDNIYLRTNTNNATHQLGTFGWLTGGSPPLPVEGTGDNLQILGITVTVSDAFVSATCASSTIRANLSWNGGTSWSSNVATGNLTTTTSTDYLLPTSGGTTSTSAWGAHVWDRAEFSDANFRVRLTALKGCGTAGTTLNVDQLQVTVYYRMDNTSIVDVVTTQLQTTTLPDANLEGPGSSCGFSIANCYKADGVSLNPRGFWATMNTQGAANVNGDAYQAFYDTTGGATNPAYDATDYYNYAIEMPAGSTNGSIYVYDPVFCETATNKGTGDRWFSGSNGVSSFYEVYDTQNTLYDNGDDGAPLASSNGLFRNIAAADTTMGGSGGSECLTSTDAAYGDGRDYHNNWYLLYSGMSGGATGHVYRIHTTSTDPANVNAQKGVNGENSFALYAAATGGTPKLYGLGAMQAFTPLSAAGSAVSSEFYLAQIASQYAGKTIEISLWDPGDTSPLSASLEILRPTSAGWTATTLDYTAAQGTTNSGAAACNALTGTGVGSIQTNVGNTTGTYNGCWLTIRVTVPAAYAADQSGWWKIRYTMNGNGTSNDVTTWTVRILGNPVHLVLP